MMTWLNIVKVRIVSVLEYTTSEERDAVGQSDNDWKTSSLVGRRRHQNNLTICADDQKPFH
jgi:hypothetical protein